MLYVAHIKYIMHARKYKHNIVTFAEMTTLGNYICVIFILLESLLINGIFTGWGMMASMLKSEDLLNGKIKYFLVLPSGKTQA